MSTDKHDIKSMPEDSKELALKARAPSPEWSAEELTAIGRIEAQWLRTIDMEGWEITPDGYVTSSVIRELFKWKPSTLANYCNPHNRANPFPRARFRQGHERLHKLRQAVEWKMRRDKGSG